MKSLIGKVTTDHIGIYHKVTSVTDTAVVLTSSNGDKSTVGLQTMIAHENISEAEYGLQPAQRLTCKHHGEWATDEHITTADHRYVVRL